MPLLRLLPDDEISARAIIYRFVGDRYKDATIQIIGPRPYIPDALPVILDGERTDRAMDHKVVNTAQSKGTASLTSLDAVDNMIFDDGERRRDSPWIQSHHHGFSSSSS